MKKIKTIRSLSLSLLLLVGSLVLLSCGGNEDQNKDVSVKEIMAENVIVADYSVDGMVCAVGCAATIQKEVSSMAGVAVCEVDFDTHKAHIEYDKTQLSEQDIISKIEGIADGQYKVNEWVEQSRNENNLEESDGAEESITSISMPSFEIPNLFTLLIDQL